VSIAGRAEGQGGPSAAHGEDAVASRLAAIAALGLAGSRRLLADPPDSEGHGNGGGHGDGDGRLLVERGAAEGLIGLLDAAVDAGLVALRDDDRAALAARAEEAGRRTEVATQEAIAASAALAALGIDHRVVDGPAVVPRVFACTGRRPFADVSLVVPFAAIDRARGLAGPTVRVGSELLPPGAGTRPRLDDLGDARVTVEVAGATLPGLPLDVALVRAAAIAARPGPVRLVALRDVAQIALAGSPSGGAVRSRARAWRCSELVADGLRRAWDTFDLADKTDLSVWAARYGAAPVRRRALRVAARSPGPAGSAGPLDRVAGPLHRLGDVFGRRAR
jgi:hypothetical protein